MTTRFESACFGHGPARLRRSRWRSMKNVLVARRAASPGLYEVGMLRLPGLETSALSRVRARERLLLRQGFITAEQAAEIEAGNVTR